MGKVAGPLERNSEIRVPVFPERVPTDSITWSSRTDAFQSLTQGSLYFFF
jgi:hypothetical protein